MTSALFQGHNINDGFLRQLMAFEMRVHNLSESSLHNEYHTRANNRANEAGPLGEDLLEMLEDEELDFVFSESFAE